MPTTNEARARLEALIEETAAAHHPVLIQGASHNAVLLSEEDWHNVTAPPRLLAPPSIRASLRKALSRSRTAATRPLRQTMLPVIQVSSARARVARSCIVQVWPASSRSKRPWAVWRCFR